MRVNPKNSTRWTRLWGHHHRNVVWDAEVSKWAVSRNGREEERRLKNEVKGKTSKIFCLNM